MKKNKLALADLKITSFVTNLEQSQLFGGALTQVGAKTLPLGDCVSDMAHSACQTCGIICHD